MLNPKEPAIRVLLADDHPIVMAGCMTSLSDFGMEVVYQAKSPAEVFEKYLELKPDVLVLDVKFGQAQTGFDAAKRILQNQPDARVVFWSQCDQDSVIKEAYRLGCFAYVTKAVNPEDLAHAITQAHKGNKYFHPDIAERLARLSIVGDQSPQNLLQERELAVFKLMAQGRTNQEIADTLDLALRTISTVTLTIKDKLGVQRPADITLLAVRNNLIEA